ncbi:MAG: hypothetical protein Q8L86_18225 [Vicinamibacterales bacterium]|nr:hypothetical protein [Vicinamibacterales bacterium]
MIASHNQIYFSDAFRVATKTLEEYGAFDVSLINDLPLFIDPFLLFNSDAPTYRRLHDQIIEYLRFLRDKAGAGPVPEGLLRAWFTFPEVRQNWLGYSLSGNRGSGLGLDFAKGLARNLSTLFHSFGAETVTLGSHLEKLCLIADGVGRDNISDFTTNLIKNYLLEYTQEFARAHLLPEQRRVVPVRKTVFNYETETWETRRFDLPFVGGDYVILTPMDLLTKEDIWINRPDLIRQYPYVVAAVPNDQLREQLNNYLSGVLTRILERDDRTRREKEGGPGRRRGRRRPAQDRQPTAKQASEAIGALVHAHPEFIDYYIRYKEDHGDEAAAQADVRVRASERLYIQQVRALVSNLQAYTEFYAYPGTTLDEARRRVAFLKDVIENKGGWRIFYVDGQPLRRESDLHIMFRLTWCNTPSDVNREVNNGRGPSDFEVSRGRFDKSLVEFKLARSTSLAKNLVHQAEAYQKASDAQHALKVIVYFTLADEERARQVLTGLELYGHPDIVLIDARDDNKPSASKIG